MREEGAAFFVVNGVPVATYTVSFDDGTGGESATAAVSRACFNKMLLVTGSNTIQFLGYWNGDSVTAPNARSTNDIRLRAANGSVIPLLSIEVRAGEVWDQTSVVSLALSTIHPQLARSVEQHKRELKVLIDRSMAAWDEEMRAMDRRLLLEKLEEAVSQLLNEFEGLPPDEILDLLFTGELESLRGEFMPLLAELRDGHSAQQDTIDRLLSDGDAALADLTNEGRLTDLGAGDGEVFDDELYDDMDGVDVGYLDDDGDGPDEQDQYIEAWRQYTTEVIEQLESCIEDGRVVQRGTFLDTVRTWSAAASEFRATFDLRADVTLEEAEAFSQSVAQISTFVEHYVDGAGWFRDAPVPMTVRDAIASYIEPYDAQRAAGLRHAMNLWLDEEATPEQQMVLRWIPVLAALYQAAAQGRADRMAVDAYADETIHWGMAAARVGVSFTPFGDAVDVCEAATGVENCLPGGRELSTFERVAAGLGTIIGNRYVWTYVGTAVAGAMTVMRKLTKIEEALSSVPPEVRQSLLARFTAETLDAVSDLRGERIVELATELGDNVFDRFARDLSGTRISGLVSDLTGARVKRLAASLSGSQVSALATELGSPILRTFCDTWPVDVIKKLLVDAPRSTIRLSRDWIVETFSGYRYVSIVLPEDTVLYRAGWREKEWGQFFVLKRPSSEIQTRIDSAVLPEWPDGSMSPIDTVFSARIPSGTTVHIGETSAHGGFYVGGTPQIVVVRPWEIVGAEVLERWQIQ